MALTKYRRRSDQLREQVLELRERGKTFDEICSELKTTIRTVRHALHAPEAERERLRRAHERALFLGPKAARAIERRLDEGDGTLGLRLLEDLGAVGREAIRVQVNAQNVQVNLSNDTLEAAKAVAAAMRAAQDRATSQEPLTLNEATTDFGNGRKVIEVLPDSVGNI
jgi:NOL1/NOP2/fmu family ribosome biogenesis protein